MDNLWQNKCSLTYSAGSSSSPQLQSQHPATIKCQYLYPHVEQKSRSRAQECVSEPPFLNTYNLGTYKSDSAEMGNLFLSVPSRSSPSLQQSSNQNPCNYAKPPINSSCAMNTFARSEDQLTPSHLISDILIKQNQKIGTGYGSVFSTSAANLNTQSSDLAQAVLHQNGSGNEKVMGNYSTREEWERVTNFSNSAKLQRHCDTSEKISSEKNSSLSRPSFNFLSGCSRVLCLSKCGDLLLSNTGLLGVVCSCHCLHMSISKFCEHSGIYDINPGHAVHMDSGETIAQWRRLYFHKLGIRVPDDHCGWDWPECFSATAGLVASNLTMPSTPSNADFYRSIGSPGTSVRFGQTRDTIPLSETSVTNQNHLNDILSNKQQRNGQVSYIKGLTGPSQSNFRPPSDNLMYQNSTMSKFVESEESDNGLMSKSRNSFTSKPTLQNLRIPYDSNLKKDSNPKETINFDQDAVSSNIELKLGQPYQQSRSSGNTLLSMVGPKPSYALGDQPKSVSRNHLIHSKQNFGSTNRFIQYPQRVSSTSDFCSSKEKNHSNLMNYALGGNYDVKVTKTDKCIEDATKSSVISIPVSHINATSEKTVHSRAYHTTHNANERSMHRAVRCEPHIGKSCASKFPCNGDNGLEIQHDALNKYIVEGKVAGCVTDENFSKRSLSFLNGGASGIGSCNPKSTTVNDRIMNPCHVSGMPRDASDGMKFLNYSGKVPLSGYSGHFNNVLNKSSNSAINPATPVPNLTTAMTNKESICESPLLDENLRMLAARHMLELYKQDDTNSSPAMTQHGSFGNSISGAGPLSEEQNHRLNLMNKTKIIGSEDEKLAPRTGLKNWWNHSTSMQGNPSCLKVKEVDMQCQSFHGPLSDKHHPPRLGGNESIFSSKGYGKTCQSVPYTCLPSNCCTIHLQNLGADCNSILQTPINTFKEQIVRVSCKDLASNIDAVCKEPTISSERDGKLDDHMPKKSNFHSFQWKDVPNKVVQVHNITHQSSPTNALDGSGCDDNQLEKTADNCPKGTEQEVNILKWKEMCNVSSGFSTPLVIQESIDATNTGSCTVDESDGRYVNDRMIDEGCNEKCGSSDDGLFGDKSAELLGSTCKLNLIKERSPKAGTNQSSCNLIDDIKLLDSLRWKKVQNQIQKYPNIDAKSKSNQLQNVEEGTKCGNIGKDMKQKSSVSNGASKQNCGTIREQSSPACNNEEMILSSDQGTSHSLDTTSQQPILNHKKSSFSTIRTTCRKRDLRKLYNHDIEVDGVSETGHADSLEVLHVSCPQKSRQDTVGSTRAECSLSMNSFIKKAKPEVYGKFGIISNGNMAPGMSKPANIVPLSKILKMARCVVPESCEARSPSKGKLRKGKSKVRREGLGGISCYKEKDSLNCKVNVRNELDPDCSIESEQNGDLHIDKEHPGREKFRSVSNTYIGASSKPKIREIRKRSLCELIGAEKKSGCGQEKRRRSLEKFSSRAVDICQDGKEWDDSANKIITEHEYKSFISDPAEFCCVCGGSNKDEINCLLKCSFCLIRVHQACYGVVKVPKGSWYCRPCRTSSKDIACVLCGYGGGAMTRALQSDNIVKGILKAWNIETVYKINDEDNYSGASIDDLGNLNSKKLKIVTSITGSSCKLKNSITAWVLDFTVKQWVHMVCGLWTPGTRCPNVDTMSAFDVSGASHPRENTQVCSMCNRSGGSYIQCRVIDCCDQFHPWCAHQKGLLQSEVEGSENESVGFYGRCVLHATCPPTIYCSESNSETGCPRGETLTCARTEGYKGRKRDGLRRNVNYQSNGNAGCLVSQEQLNVWLHINRQKRCTKGTLKQPISDSEYDCRKEYARYKHAKAWKHLVVYKSGIHALGLYTSRLITRGAMVVEYVGEIVGLRVADKRECEYQSGRKLQYKSACYFFKIDKEHIIDATCKGGIARFVNHSCMPNCVAKIISLRNEKKVVFFAERDIYPGEEITYDYHFNHEDEGEKIPCFCNAKNCRRYMN